VPIRKVALPLENCVLAVTLLRGYNRAIINMELLLHLRAKAISGAISRPVAFANMHLSTALFVLSCLLTAIFATDVGTIVETTHGPVIGNTRNPSNEVISFL
jgi:hypothetical protein